MTIQKAIDKLGGQTALAKAMGVSQGFIWQLLNGRCKVPAHRCLAIEKATDGVVTRYELRPDVFGTAPASEAMH